ncbi:MAG: hypothetical protein O3C49_07825 [Proteobacteria bacterium]|nr:hypothetical protein [Pseudomonadota bacterium]MDA1323452.1 hypothetical protein [Pseudomonadota bacterium]
MTAQKLHEIWVEQYEAAQGIKQRYGLKAAFDYLVAEKLLNFAEAAEEHREFARELPRFVSQVRLMFTPLEIRSHIARIERELHEKSLPNEDDDDLIKESPSTIAKRAGQFATIKELLTATELGTS